MRYFRIFIVTYAILVIISILWLGREAFVKKDLPQETSSIQAPELKDILDPSNEKKRIAAARKLAERVGVEEALEILYASPLPHTGDGHLVVHQIGFYAYKEYGLNAILKCKDYFLYACYHGAIIEAATDQGFEGITKMTDRCKESFDRFFQCTHAAGHALLAMWNYDLPKALASCDELYENDSVFPEALSSCHNGAFMENIFGVHDWDTNKEQKRDWLSDDPYFPCNYFGPQYQEGCWMNQASRIYQINKGDVVKTTEDCAVIGNEQYTHWCIDNLARQLNPLTQGDPHATFLLCQQMGTKWYDSCIIINAVAFYSVSGREEAITICRQINKHVKQDCYQALINKVKIDYIENSVKENLCKKMENPFSEQCLETLGH